MSRARVAVLKVISKQLSVTAAAAEYGYSRQHLHGLVARYRVGGLFGNGTRNGTATKRRTSDLETRVSAGQTMSRLSESNR